MPRYYADPLGTVSSSSSGGRGGKKGAVQPKVAATQGQSPAAPAAPVDPLPPAGPMPSELDIFDYQQRLRAGANDRTGDNRILDASTRAILSGDSGAMFRRTNPYQRVKPGHSEAEMAVRQRQALQARMATRDEFAKRFGSEVANQIWQDYESKGYGGKLNYTYAESPSLSRATREADMASIASRKRFQRATEGTSAERVSGDPFTAAAQSSGSFNRSRKPAVYTRDTFVDPIDTRSSRQRYPADYYEEDDEELYPEVPKYAV